MPEQRSPALGPDEITLVLCYFQLTAVCKWACAFNMERELESGLLFEGVVVLLFKVVNLKSGVERKQISCSSSEFCRLPAR